MLNNTVNSYMANRFHAIRRDTIKVRVGNAWIGGNAPILIQSMTTTQPKDIENTLSQVLALANASCKLIRITVPTLSDAQALEELVQRIRATGCNTPLSADIHFQPKAALEALKWVEKVRINPGNFADSSTDAENFEKGEKKVREHFLPFLEEAKKYDRAIRIGVNHGSLSPRMLYKYGDTVDGMVESALEYLSICEEVDFDRVVVSMKSSNPKVAIQAYRLLAQKLKEKNFKAYPFHLGVTEAGEGEDGRLKSAVGIGALLLDGIGDTIRVSLTEDAVAEIPVARDLIEATSLVNIPKIDIPDLKKDPFSYSRRESEEISIAGTPIGGKNPIRVGERALVLLPTKNLRAPEFPLGSLKKPPVVELSSTMDIASFAADPTQYPSPSIFCYTGNHIVPAVRMLASLLDQYKRKDPILLYASIGNQWVDKIRVAASWGSLLADGIGDAVCIESTNQGEETASLSYDILQAAGARRSKTEFISCPGCGRTLFDIQKVLAKIKERFGHLTNVSIAVMGCIVNGPGEMADADFGYVGGAPGKITLYEGKTPIKKNIPEEDAIEELVDCIKSRGLWKEPETH